MTATLEETPTITDENAGIPPFLLDLMGRIEMEPTFKSERGLLYSFAAPKPPAEELHAAISEIGAAVKSNEFEVLVKPETVTFRSITRTSGINRYSKKQYTSWKTDVSTTYSFKTVRHGHRVLRIYKHLTRTQRYRGSFTNATGEYVQRQKLGYGGDVPDFFMQEKSEESANKWTRWALPRDEHARASKFAAWAMYQILKELDPTNPAFNAVSFFPTAAYPVLQLFPNSILNVEAIRACIPKNFSLHTEPDVKKFIRKNFGEDGIRKDMVKAVVNTTDINALFLAAQLKELFPLDWLRDLVKNPLDFAIYNTETTYTPENTEGLKALLGQLTLPQRKRLLVEKRNNRDEAVLRYLIRDAVRIYSQLNREQKQEYRGTIDYSSWHTLHDTLAEVRRDIDDAQTILRSYEGIEWGDKTYMAKLHDTSYVLDGETYTITAPRSRHDLTDWGRKMHNCIGSYYYQVSHHDTNVFAVCKNNELFGNIEIDTAGTIRQYMQKYNVPVPHEHETALLQHIENVEADLKKRLRVQEAMKNRKQKAVTV